MSYLDSLLGTAGKNGFTNLIAGFVQPSVGATRQINVASTSALAAGLGVFIAVGGNYTITSVDDATHITVQNLGSNGNAAPGAAVANGGLVTAAGAPGAQGTPGAPIPITTVILSNVANLAAAPSANDGYNFSSGDIVGLGGQTTVAQNGIYTYSAGVLTPVSPQPPTETLLRTTKGINYANQLYSYQSGALTPVQTSAGVIQGLYTATNIAPDAQGVVLIENAAIPKQSVANDAAFHSIWSFDFVARGYITGRLKIVASATSVSGAKETEFNLRASVKCSATPPAGALSAVNALDAIDDGSGPYGDMRFFVVGTAVQLQVKTTQASDFFAGIVGLAVFQ